MSDEEIECLERRETEDRRKCADCESHPGMETFKTQIKTGIFVAAFFLIYFMSLMSSATDSQSERMTTCEKEIKSHTEIHEGKVQVMIDKITKSVNEINVNVQRMGTAVDALVKVSEYERVNSAKERERNRIEIENIKQKGIKEER